MYADIFDSLTREFSRNHRVGGPWQLFHHMLQSWISDDYYDAVALEVTMKRYSGPRQRMFGYLPAKNCKKLQKR